MGLFIKIDKKQLEKRLDHIEKGLINLKPILWEPMAILYDRMTNTVFKLSGGRFGRPKWAPIDPAMYKTRKKKNGKGLTKPKLRYGTSGPPTKRRFSATDNPLLATGGYQKSFGLISTGAKKMLYGSQMAKTGSPNLAKDIQKAGRGHRYVLPVYNHPQTQRSVKGVLRNFLNHLLGKGR